LETEATQVDTVIDAAINEALPLATRNYIQLTLLVPGSVTTDPSSFDTGDNTASGGRPLINGNREQANNFILDGMDNNQVSDNLLGYTPAPDATEEFNLITNNAPAEFGNFENGVVSARAAVAVALAGAFLLATWANAKEVEKAMRRGDRLQKSEHRGTKADASQGLPQVYQHG
jgi:hypothetical protein